MNDEPMTLQEIAKAEGISHQAIAEILERAYRKIRKLLQEKGINQSSDVL
jgi:DNA-directed RNA polymerase sigma subunit (sigma70/sigma32)